MRTVMVVALAWALLPAALGAESHRVIFDTDFGLPPSDDGMALLFALGSPEIELLGVTTVAGNDSVEQATADALRMLEIVGRPEIPVFRGADMPLVHEKSAYAVESWGRWYSDEPAKEPPGGFADGRAEPESAAEFIARTVSEHPGEVTLVAIGPLTNVAIALRSQPGLASKLKGLVIMGGAVASLPDGAGNVTPNAEFNFWVDPEAARAVLRSGAEIVLSPLNVSRKTALTKPWYEAMVATGTPVGELLSATLGAAFETEPERTWLMYDQVAVASLVAPELVTAEPLYVDVDVHHGISYGVSVGGRQLWPGAEGARRVSVQHDLDWPAFIELFAQRVRAAGVASSRPPP